MPYDMCYGRGRITHDCLRLGWTEWVYRDKDSRRIVTLDEAKRIYDGWPNGLASYTELLGIRITAFGRQALRENPA